MKMRVITRAYLARLGATVLTAGLVATLISACGGGGTSAPAAAALFGTKQLGASGADTRGFSTATDGSGNVYVTGATTGGLNGNPRTGTIDVFLIKYNSAGGRLYTKQLGAAGASTTGRAVATDGNGNVYVAGYTSGVLNGNPLTGTEDFFLTKYDSTGGWVYTRQLGVAGAYTEGYSVATDGNGNVYVAGYTSGGLNGNPLTGTEDFFLTKYDSTGGWVYTKQLGVALASTRGYSVATDRNGNVYVAGSTDGNLSGNGLTGMEDFFLTKYDSAGTRVYTEQLGVNGARTRGFSVATDGSNNVYVSGYASGGLNANTVTGLEDFFLTKYDSAGTRLFTKQLGVAGAYTDGYAVATDGNGNVYVAGYTSGGLNGNPLTGTNDLFLTKYDSAGGMLYTKQLGAAGADTIGNAVVADGGGNVYVAGYTTGGLDGNSRAGTVDFFVTRYSGANGAKN